MIRHLRAILLTLLTAAAVQAQPLADHVPGDALVYVGWRGVDDPDLGYEGSNLEALGSSAQLPATLGQALNTIERVGGRNPFVPMVVGFVRSIGSSSWHLPTAAYLQPTDDMNFPVRFTVLWQAQGEQAEALFAKLQDMKAQVPPSAPLLIGQGDGLVSLTIGMQAEEAETLPAPLAEKEGFASAMQQVDNDGAFVLYADAQGLLGLIDRLAATETPREQEQWMKVRAALGLEGLNGLATSAGFDGKDWLCEMFIDAPAPRTGLLTLLDGEPISDDELKAIPIEATWLTAFRLDLGKVLDEVRRVAGEIDPDAQQKINEALLKADEMTGVDIEQDLIRSFGSSWMLYTDPGAIGSGIMGLCLVNPLNNADAAERSLISLQAIANAFMGQMMNDPRGPGIRIRFHSMEEGGMTIHTLGVPFVAPTWSIYDGKLYVGFYKQTVLTAGDRAMADGPSILENERFQAVMDRLDAGVTPQTIVFTDLPRTAEGSYQNLVMLSQMGTGFLTMFGGQSVPDLLPPYARIEPLLAASGEVAWTDDAGYHGRTLSPFPGSVFLGPGGNMNTMSTAPMMLGTLLPALGAARQSARQMKSTTQCRGIVQSQVTYASGNHDVYTNDIAELYENNHFSADYTVSPRAPINIPRGFNQLDMEDQKQWIRENASYILIPDLKMDINSETVCVFERPDHTGGAGIAVGFNDGRAQFMNEWEARELIEAQTDKTLEELIQRQQNYQPPVPE